MSINIKVLISAIVVGLVYTLYVTSLPLPDEGWAQIGQALGILQGTVAIAIVYAIAGFFAFKVVDISWGKRLLRALAWFGISLVIILPITFIGERMVAPAKIEEWRKRNQVQETNSDPYVNVELNRKVQN